VQHTEQLVSSIAGTSLEKYVRPPFGAYDAKVVRVLVNNGYEIILWNRDTRDWEETTSVDDIVRVAGRESAPGDIILMHNVGFRTAEALPKVLAALPARPVPVRASTVSEVLGR